MKLQFFGNDDFEGLDKSVQSFLQEDVELIDIKYSSTASENNFVYTAIVMYKEIVKIRGCLI